MSRVLVLMHVACEPAAEYGAVLRERGVEIVELLLTEGAELPDWRGFAGIIAMGGPMGANDDDTVPWIAREKAFIREAVTAGMPFWGICLGAQLLAAALGARVYTGAEPEVGMSRIALTADAADDPVFGMLPAEFPAFQWHGDSFDLPNGATWLARNSAYANQAFSIGAAYGIQFHVEVDEPLAQEWLAIPEYAASLAAVHGAGAGPRVLADLVESVDETIRLARELFAAWLDAYVLVPS